MRTTAIGLALAVGIVSSATAFPQTSGHGGPTQGAGAEEDTPPQIHLIRTEPAQGAAKFFGRLLLRVIDADGGDLAHDLGYFEEDWTALSALLTRRFSAGPHAVPYADLEEGIMATGGRLYGLSLDLSPDDARSIARRLGERLVDPGQRFAIDPLRDTGSLRAAQLLDEVLGGTLSQQASLPVEGDRRSWSLHHLRAHPVAWSIADLLLRPGQGELHAWELAHLPAAFEQIVSRASLEGRPLVLERYHRGVRPDAPAEQTRGGWPPPGVMTLLIPLALLGRWWPRLVALLGGGFMGFAGVLLVLVAVGPQWSGLALGFDLLLLPPTHLILAFLALSYRPWRYFRTARWVYLVLCFSGSAVLVVAALLGWVPPLSPSAATAGIAINLGLLMGFRREGPRVGALSSEMRPRAISFIERNSPYVGRSGRRIR